MNYNSSKKPPRTNMKVSGLSAALGYLLIVLLAFGWIWAHADACEDLGMVYAPTGVCVVVD